MIDFRNDVELTQGLSKDYPIIPQAFDCQTLLEYLKRELNIDQDNLLSRFGIPFKAEPVGDGGSSNIIDEYRQERLSYAQILAIYWMAKQYGTKKAKGLKTPYKYCRTVFLSGKWNDTLGENPGEKFFMNEELFNKFFVRLIKLDPLNFIRSLFYADCFGDIAIEMALYKPIIQKYIASETTSKMLIVDPHPDFVNEFLSVPTSHNITFLFFEKELYDIFTKEYGSGNYRYFSESQEPVYEWGRLQDYDKYNHVIVFGNRDTKYLKRFLEEINSHLESDGDVSLLMPNAIIDKHSDGIRRIIEDNISIDSISILPSEVFTSRLRKHVAIMGHKKNGGEGGRILLKRILFKKFEKKRNLIAGNLIFEPWSLSITNEDFVGEDSRFGKCTINQLFEYSRPKTEAVNRATKKYDLTPEITIWYSWSNGRGRISYYSTIEEAKKGGKVFNRGDLLLSKEIKAKTEDRALGAIRKRILGNEKGKADLDFLDAIRKDIDVAFLGREKRKEVSLLTYWICRRDIIADERNYKHELCLRLFDSPIISNRKSSENISREDMAKEIGRLIGSQNNEEVLKYLRQLNYILREANSEGLFLSQDISEFINLSNSNKKGLKEARASLTKRSYTVEEEKELVNYLVSKLRKTQELKYLGALICFFTGCSNREVAALSVKDRDNMAGLRQHQFLIYKDFDIASGKPEKIKATANHTERYRKVPIVAELDALIKQYINIDSDADLDNNPPLLYREEGKSRTYITPNDIREAKVEAENSLGLDGEKGFAKISNKEVETDFDRYKGDRFRSNFEYKLIQVCMMSMAEANYVLGRSQENTFAKHYCDYTNDFSQIMLKDKMERWSTTFAEIVGNDDEEDTEERDAFFEKRIRTTKKVIPDRVDEKLTTNIYATIAQNKSETTITVSDDRGVDIVIDTVVIRE